MWKPIELWSHTRPIDQMSCEAKLWERGQFVEFISSRAVRWCLLLMKFILCCGCRWKCRVIIMCGFTAQLVEHRTGIAEVTGSNPVETLMFFRFLSSNCLSWKIYCDDHSSLSSSTAAQYEFHIYFTSSHCTGRHEFNKLTSLPTCGFTAQLITHRTDIAEVTGSNPVETLLFFRLLRISQIRQFTVMIILHFHLQHCLTKASNTSPVKDQKTKST